MPWTTTFPVRVSSTKRAYKMSSNDNNMFAGAPVPRQWEAENSDGVFEPPTKLAVLGMWRSEFFALVISLSAFAVTLAISGAFDEKLQPKFPPGLNINTLISASSTVMRAAMVFVLAEGTLKRPLGET